MNTGSILKKFRKNRHLSQQSLCEGIITRQTYSKIENNQLEPNYEILLHLLDRLGYEVSDFAREVNRNSNSSKFYKLFLKGIGNDLTITEATALFEYVQSKRYISSRDFHLYGVTKGHLHKKFPTIIPAYTEEDKEYFRNFIKSSFAFYGLYDLKIIGDFLPHLLTYKEIKTLYKNLPDFPPLDYVEDSEIYRTQIHKIYNNICEIAIFSGDPLLAKEVLEKHKSFSKVHPELRYLIYIQINEISIDYLLTNNKLVLDKLLDISKAMQLIGENVLSEAIVNQHKTLLKEKEYNSIDTITYD